MATSRKRLVALAAIGLVALTLFQVGGTAPEAGARVSNVLRLVWWIDVGFPTPFAFSTVGPGGVVRLSLIYDTLTWKDSRGLIPWLATSWTVSPDGRTYTFTLHGDVRWQDGHPFSAEDVRFSFAYYRRHPFPWVSVTPIKAVTVRDARTLSITLSEPFAPFLAEIAGIVPIIPAHIWRGISDPVKAQRLSVAVGTGPYRLAAYDALTGESDFLANPAYFEGKPYVREIRYQVLPTEQQQLLAIQQGRTDDALTTDYSAVDAFRDRLPLRVLTTEPLSVSRLIFNTRRPPFDDVRLRQAVAYALPRAQIAEAVTHGPALVGGPGVIPPGSPWYDPHVRQYPYDSVRAIALLDRSGYRAAGAGARTTPAGAPLRIELLTSPEYSEAPLIQQALRRLGIDVALVSADPKTRAALQHEGRFQMALTTHIIGGDPDYLRRWFTGAEANAFAQGTVLENSEFLRLADQQVATLDPAGRRRLISRMQAILAEEVPTLPLYYRRFYWIYNGAKLRAFDTPGGLMNGIPLIENKIAFLSPPGTP